MAPILFWWMLSTVSLLAIELSQFSFNYNDPNVLFSRE